MKKTAPTSRYRFYVGCIDDFICIISEGNDTTTVNIYFITLHCMSLNYNCDKKLYEL
jgi:hypothetical protein